MRTHIHALPNIRLACVLALLLVPAPRGPAQNSAPALPADLQTFLADARRRLTANDMAGLRELGESPDTISWTGESAGFGEGRIPWQLNAIRVPSRSQAPEWLAVFASFHTCESTGDHFHPLVRAAAGWRFGPEIRETDTRGFRVRDHRLDVRYDLPAAACRVTDDVTIERTDPQAGTCFLRLSSDMHLDRATHGGTAFDVQAAPGLIAFLPPEGRTFTLSLAYHGTVNHRISDYIRTTEAVMVSYWYPHIARLPAKSTITVTVPKGWTAVAGGDLVRQENPQQSVRFTYRNEVPTCYFTLDAGPYTVTTRKLGARTLSAYLLHPDAGLARRSLDEVAGALPFFEQHFGTFPYGRYGVVQTNGTLGGAMEAYSFATFDPGTMPGAIVHELSHTWWGGIVPNPYTRDMWNEGFAQYCDDVYHRLSHNDHGPALRGMHADDSRGRGLLRNFSVPLDRAHDTSSGVESEVGYGKGQMVMEMLEDLAGTDTMLRAMRRFRDDHQPGEPGDWAEFERALQRVSGKDWRWFFDQWLTRPGLPVVSLSGVQVKSEAGGTVVEGHIVQEAPAYRLRLPLVVQTPRGPVRKTVEASGLSTDFRIVCPAAPTAVRLDPDGSVAMAGPAGGPNPFEWHP